MELRPYQIEAVEAIFTQFREGIRKTLLVLPTGTGKTIVFAEVIRRAVLAGGRVLILAHREELLQQAADKLAQFYDVPVTELLDDYSRFLLNDPPAQLRQRRMESCMTRESFAQQLGTSLSNLERWETGKCTISYKCWERYFKGRA